MLWFPYYLDSRGDNVKIVVFGANGPTGRLLTEQALDEGHQVTAVTRHPGEFPIEHAQLHVFAGDVYDLPSVIDAVDGHDAVLSTLGVPYGFKKITVFSEGIANIVKAMRRNDVRRIVCVSSSATDPAVRFHDTGGGFFFEKILKPTITFTMGRTLYVDMLKMENLVKASGLDWTIVRPSGLFNRPEGTDYRTAESFINGRFTMRADLADCMLRQLESSDYLCKVVAVATFAVQPTMMELTRNEAFKAPANRARD